MKVLFVSSGNSRLGISPIVKSQGESLRKELTKLDYFPISGKGIHSYIKHIYLLKKDLKKNEYDIIHSHYGLCGIVSHLARKKEKLVVSFMGDDLIGEINSEGKYSIFGNLLVSLNINLLRRYDFNIVKSTNLSKKINDIDRKAIIPNGVDLNIFYEVEFNESRKHLNLNDGNRLIIFVANPERKEKNYKLAEEAINAIWGYQY